jgi:hypothetical protein
MAVSLSLYPRSFNEDNIIAPFVIPAHAEIQVNRIGMDPGFHRGDDKAGMTIPLVLLWTGFGFGLR